MSKNITYALTKKGQRLGKKIRQAKTKAIDDFFLDEFLKEDPTIEEKLNKLRKKPKT